jgi:hypothetical protein
MEWFGCNYYEIIEAYIEIESYDELIKRNEQLEKIICNKDKSFEPLRKTV